MSLQMQPEKRMRSTRAMIKFRLGIMPISLAYLDELQYFLYSIDLNLLGPLDYELLVSSFVNHETLLINILVICKKIINVFVVNFYVRDPYLVDFFVYLVLFNGLKFFNSIEEVLHCEDEHA